MRLRAALAAALLITFAGWQGCSGEKRDGKGRSSPQSERGFPGPAGAGAGTRQQAPVKFIEIDLSKQRLMAYEDGRLVREMAVSTGKESRTPTGDFRIWRKNRLKDMKIGLPVLGNYYVLEDVPWIMYYYNAEYPKERGFAIHGAWWHADFGRPASHGCINLPVDDARELFFWTDPQVGALEEATATGANPGTRVVVFESATRDGP